MAKATVFCLFFLIKITYSYSQIYYPFPMENAIWSELIVQPNSINPNVIDSIPRNYFTHSDTSINGYLYTKLYLSKDTFFTSSSNSSAYFGAYRKQDRQVLFIKSNTDFEELLYDFNISLGDTVELLLSDAGDNDWVVLHNIDSVLLLDNTLRRRYNFHTINSNVYVYSWIEGIGNTNGLLYKIPFSNIPSYNYLLCFKEEEELIWSNKNFDFCYFSITPVSSKEVVTKKEVFVFPNPSSNNISIQYLNYSPTANLVVSIFDVYGVLITEFKSFTGKNITNFSLNALGIPKGVYFIAITDVYTNLITKVIYTE